MKTEFATISADQLVDVSGGLGLDLHRASRAGDASAPAGGRTGGYIGLGAGAALGGTAGLPGGGVPGAILGGIAGYKGGEYIGRGVGWVGGAAADLVNQVRGR